MSRIPDASIPSTETLFRAIDPKHIEEGEVLEGGVEAPRCIAEGAIDLPRCSFNREAGGAWSVITENRRGFFPAGLPLVDLHTVRIDRPGSSPYLLRVVDDPNPSDEPSNDWHCEVQMMRETDSVLPRNPDWKSDAKTRARRAIVRRMFLVEGAPAPPS